jgi:hypothetical protein
MTTNFEIYGQYIKNEIIIIFGLYDARQEMAEQIKEHHPYFDSSLNKIVEITEVEDVIKDLKQKIEDKDERLLNPNFVQIYTCRNYPVIEFELGVSFTHVVETNIAKGKYLYYYQNRSKANSYEKLRFFETLLNIINMKTSEFLRALIEIKLLNNI